MPKVLMAASPKTSRIYRLLGHVRVEAPAGVIVHELPTARSYGTVLRMATAVGVDAILLDAHGTATPDMPPAFGGAKEQVLVETATVRHRSGLGISVPLLVLGVCHGGTQRYRTIVEQCLDVQRIAYLGCTGRAEYDDATVIFPVVLQVLADLGAKAQSPEAIHEALLGRRDDLGERWMPYLLQKRPPT